MNGPIGSEYSQENVRKKIAKKKGGKRGKRRILVQERNLTTIEIKFSSICGGEDYKN